MASIGQLVRAVAEVSGLDEASVKIIARYLREAGFVGQRSTGAGAARMTSIDAASLIIAVNASQLAKDSADTVREYGALPLNYIAPLQDKDECYAEVHAQLSAMPRLDRALSFLLGFYSEDDLTSAVIEFRRPWPQVWIRVGVTQNEDDIGETVAQSIYRPSTTKILPNVDRTITTTISHKTLRAIARTIAE